MGPIKKQDGSTATTEEEILDAWADHYEALGTPTESEEFDQQFARRVRAEVKLYAKETHKCDDPEIDREFDMEELEVCLAKLEDHKAEAEDGTRNPAFKRGGQVMRNNLLSLFNFLRNKEDSPGGWSHAQVVNLYKDGDRCDPGNYRGISLISCIGKVYLLMWANRLTKFFEKKLCDEQGGFRPDRSTTGDSVALREICLRRYKQKLLPESVRHGVA